MPRIYLDISMGEYVEEFGGTSLLSASLPQTLLI